MTERLHVGVGEVFGHLAFPSFAACTVGWLAYRRRYPTRLATGIASEPDRRAVLVGSAIVGALLAAFVIGPTFGIAPWMSAVVADAVLIVVTRFIPWRHVPVLTALGVAFIAAVVALVVPADLLTAALRHDAPVQLAGLATAATGTANVVNNLPAVLLAVNGVHHMSWGMWAWLLGVNTGAVLLPIGALANLLWLRVVRNEGLRIGLRTYTRITLPIAGPALVAAIVTLAIERALPI